MGILFEREHNTCMENCSNNFFFWFYEKFDANEGVLPILFMLTKTFVTSSFCVMTHQNIALYNSTISRYKLCKKLQWDI